MAFGLYTHNNGLIKTSVTFANSFTTNVVSLVVQITVLNNAKITPLASILLGAQVLKEIN